MSECAGKPAQQAHVPKQVGLPTLSGAQSASAKAFVGLPTPAGAVRPKIKGVKYDSGFYHFTSRSSRGDPKTKDGGAAGQ